MTNKSLTRIFINSAFLALVFILCACYSQDEDMEDVFLA
jgi:hypothetical protein